MNTPDEDWLIVNEKARSAAEERVLHESDAFLRFTRFMHRKLELNRYKGSWRSEAYTRLELVNLLMQEVHELVESLTSQESLEEISFEAADVANVAMIISDLCGAQ